jgi:formylglycine-generating enzyme required for sulfatase activity
MHQETLLYMWHRLPYSQKRKPGGVRYEVEQGTLPASRTPVRIPAGTATLGANRATARFGWDNEFDEHQVHVPAFDIDPFNVTNGEFLEFVRAGGYADATLWSAENRAWIDAESVRHPAFWIEEHGQWFWRGMFELIPLPLSWPVYVSQAEASAFARWSRKRLPTEAEFHRAAYAAPDGSERAFPWGDEPPDHSRGNFDLFRCDPVPVGSFPAGASFWGVDDLLGNGWEWTSTVFSGFPGFSPSPLYPALNSRIAPLTTAGTAPAVAIASGLSCAGSSTCTSLSVLHPTTDSTSALATSRRGSARGPVPPEI